MAKKPTVQGFGFDAAESQHHFLVQIPPRESADVRISEHFTFDVEAVGRRDTRLQLGSADSGLRVVLSRARWNEMAEEAKAELNRRLKAEGKRAVNWRVGDNYVDRLLGKELTLLAWAIEDAEPTLIPVAVRNWRGLTPEERWWLYTMTNAATGHAREGRNKGWRKAVRFALTENPAIDAPLLDRKAFGVSLSLRAQPDARKKRSDVHQRRLFD